MLSAIFSFLWWILTSVLGFLLSPIPLGTIIVGFAYLYYHITKEYDFWPSRGVSGPKATFPWGTSFGPPFVGEFRRFNEWLYNEHGGKKFCGYMEIAKPVLYVGDLDLIRSITTKDFEHFTDRRAVILNDEFEKALFAINGQEWKDTRSALTPTFSASKLRGMHQLCLDNAKNLSKYMREEMKTKPEIALKDAFGRFTMDNIASCGFGVNCNSFNDPNCEFAKKAAKLFEPPAGLQALRLFLILLFGDWLVKVIPDPEIDTARFFAAAIRRTRAYREATGEKRGDFLQLLIDTKDNEGKQALTEKCIMAQCVLFFIAGYDTTAALLTFSAYCLATEPEWQRKVHEELDQVLEKHNGELTYEAIGEMTVLDLVMSETLRLYPSAIAIERKCSKDYVLPNTDVKIPRGTIVQMPVFPLHRDPAIWPDPEKFNPNRFLPAAKESRHPCAYIPFGAGPRNCIARRFALFEAKVALAAVLMENVLEPGPSTPPPPMPLDDKGFILAPRRGCGYLSVVPRA